jgi:glutamine amidotransferase
MIAIVDYGVGNITSVRRALEHLGHACAVTCDPDTIKHADRLILPGVGNFRATQALSKDGLLPALKRQISLGTPLLGICLGMQWLFESSEEAPGVEGLGAFRGACQAFPPTVKSPHVGWNQLEIQGNSRLLRTISSGEHVYFTHSYRAPLVEEAIAVCNYGGVFSAAIERDNVFAVQFHPEKSGDIGLAVLANFLTC